MSHDDPIDHQHLMEKTSRVYGTSKSARLSVMAERSEIRGWAVRTMDSVAAQRAEDARVAEERAFSFFARTGKRYHAEGGGSFAEGYLSALRDLLKEFPQIVPESSD